MFLYGPPGTGKTSIAERLIRVHDDFVLVPKAVEVDSQIITVFDPVVHRPARRAARRARSPLGAVPPAVHHRRRRAAALHARPHLRAGERRVPRTDPDAGQQRRSRDRRLRPSAHDTRRTLLNRWIVPLDRRRSTTCRSATACSSRSRSTPRSSSRPTSSRRRWATRRSSGASRTRSSSPTIADEEFDEVLAPRRPRSTRWSSAPGSRGLPAQGQPRARRRRPAPVPARRGVQDPQVDLRVLHGASRPGQGHDRPHRRDLLHARDAGCTASVVAHHPRARRREEQPRGGAPASGVQQATDPETAQLQRRQAAQAQTPAAAVPQQPTGGSH